MLWKRTTDDLNVEQVADARPVQQQFWLLQQMVPEVGIANIAAKLSWNGPLDLLLLQESLSDLVVRHRYLRTTVEYQDDRLEQITHTARSVPVAIVDLRSVPAAERAARVEEELTRAAHEPIPTDQFPWIRATAIRAGETQFEIAIVVSHLLCDGLSMGVLCAEMMQSYAARMRGEAPQWNSAADIDLAATGIETESPESPPARIDLPYDFAIPAAPSYRGSRLTLALTAAQSKALIALSRGQQVSPFVTWLSLLHIVAYRYSGAEQIEIEIPVSGRDRSSRRAVGPLLQSTTLCLTATDSSSFNDLLTANAAEFELSNKKISHAASRRAQLLLDYQSALDEVPLSDEITVRPGEISNGSAIAELRVGVRRRRRNFEVQIDYDSDLFLQQTTQRFFAHLQQVLDLVTKNPEICLGEIELLTDNERHLLQRVNQTSRKYDSSQLVDAMIAEQVASRATSPAITHGASQWSYGDLRRRATQIASALLKQGVERGDRVALLLDRGLEAVASVYAILQCGAAFVPVDPEYPAQRQSLVLDRASVKCVITTTEYTSRIPANIARLELASVSDSPGQDRPYAPTLLSDSRVSSDIAYVLFTSGSTGDPKGVQVTHRNLVNFFVGMDALQTDDRPGCWLALTSMSFDISIYELLWTLARGYHVVIEDDPLGIRERKTETIADRIRKHRVTHLQCTPALMQSMLREPANRPAMAGLQKIFVGGDAMPLALAEQLAELATGDVYNMYGPTETTIWSTAWKVDGEFRDVSIGSALANTQIQILDSALRPVPVGVTGELFIGGDGVTAGYFQDPQRTDERFVNIPGSGRMFRTGDLVRMHADGNLQFLGRSDQQIKLNGHRLELGEIEVALRERALIEEAVAVLHESPGETKKIVAFVRAQGPDENWPDQQAGLLSSLKQRLPSYMIPSRIERVQRMPLTPARKVDRKSLMSMPLSRPSASRGADTESERDSIAAENRVASESSMSLRIRSVVCDELQLDELPIGADLASLGINSLEVVRLAERIESEFGVRPPIALFFRSLSLEDAITAAIEEANIRIPTKGADRDSPRVVVAHRPSREFADQPVTDQPVMGQSVTGQSVTGLPIAEQELTDTGTGFHGPTDDSAIASGSVVQIPAGRSSAMDRLAQVSDSFLAALDDESLHPYARFVDPVKSDLLARAGLNKTYVRGEGCFVWDEAGNRYVDFVAQYGALPFGYNPPEIWQALIQMRDNQLPNLATNSLLDSAGKLAERLLALAPEMRHVIFCNSGAECTEVAIKLCRSATNRMGILSTKKGFHGLTTGAVAVTGSDSFRDGFVADEENYHHVPYGDSKALRRVLETSAGDYAAFIVEPIQGEAGIIVPPDGYLAEARKLCTQYDVLLVVDEVQTGLGRTGSLFGCDHDDVIPDVMLIAKALGGGLVPVGAVMCQSKAYSDRFGLRHSSTFAGNALACQAGMASLDKLLADDAALIEHVAECGAYLQQGLQAIQQKYPELVREVRGRGYMQAIEFEFSSLDKRPGLLGFLADQQMLIYLAASHLLHLHNIRVAPSFVGRDVVRIEPPLTAGRKECDLFLTAMDATLGVIQSGNTAALLAPMAGADPQEMLGAEVESSDPLATTVTENGGQTFDAEYGFLVHLSSLEDLISYDCSLSAFSRDQLERLKSQLVRTADPFVIGQTALTSKTGQSIRGHFVMVPYTPTELQEMSPEKALMQVTLAADAARVAGAQLIGLGGFTSIASMGGVALPQDELPPITSGNSFTVAATLMALNSVCQKKNVALSASTAAVIGATGQTGRALAVLLGVQTARVILIGRDGTSASTQSRLREVAASVVDHLCTKINDEQLASDGLLADVYELGSSGREQILDRLLESGRIVLASDLSQLEMADLVVTASSATESFIQTNHLKQSAIVIDASRPANVSEQVRALRQDVTWVEGGIIELPGSPQLNVYAGPTPDRTFACVAEAMLWALEPSVRTERAEVVLQPERIRRLAELADLHGFRVIL